MNPLDHAEHIDLGHRAIEHGPYDGTYLRATDPILLAMQEVCRAADAIDLYEWLPPGASIDDRVRQQKEVDELERKLSHGLQALRNLLKPPQEGGE